MYILVSTLTITNEITCIGLQLKKLYIFPTGSSVPLFVSTVQRKYALTRSDFSNRLWGDRTDVLAFAMTPGSTSFQFKDRSHKVGSSVRPYQQQGQPVPTFPPPAEWTRERKTDIYENRKLMRLYGKMALF